MIIYTTRTLKARQNAQNARKRRRAFFLPSAQIKGLESPPRDAYQQKRYQNPKAPTDETVVTVPLAHLFHDLNGIRHAVGLLNDLHLVEIFEFEKGVNDKNGVALLAYIVRDIDAVGVRDCIMRDEFPNFGHDYGLRFTSVQT